MSSLPAYKTTLRLPALYPILDTAVFEARGFDVVPAAQTMLDAGVGILQYRHKRPFTEQRYQEASEVCRLCNEAGALFFMNDRADFAKLLNAGLHIGQNDLPPAPAREVLGADLPIGYSTHNEAQFLQAVTEPVDYIALGPIFETGSKENPDPVVGLEELRRLRSFTSKPLVAIGGISQERANHILEHGANAIALISGLLPQHKGDLRALQDHVLQWLAITDQN